MKSIHISIYIYSIETCFCSKKKTKKERRTSVIDVLGCKLTPLPSRFLATTARISSSKPLRKVYRGITRDLMDPLKRPRTIGYCFPYQQFVVYKIYAYNANHINVLMYVDSHHINVLIYVHSHGYSQKLRGSSDKRKLET